MRKLFQIFISLLILLLNSSCWHLQHMPVYPKEIVIDENSNFRMIVIAPGSKMRFLVDGKEVCPDRMVYSRVLEICIHVEAGEHVLRVEIMDGELSAESEFTMGEKTLWADIRYIPVLYDEDNNSPSSKKRKLLVAISEHYTYGIA